MDNVLSETDLVCSGLSWGEWKFSIPEERLREKLASVTLPRDETGCFDDDDEEEERWRKLFSIVFKEDHVYDCVLEGNKTSENAVSDVEMDNVIPLEACLNDDVEINVNTEDASSYQDLIISVVDTCTRLVSLVKSELSKLQAELEPVVKDVKKIDEKCVKSVLENSWSQLQSDESKLIFCVVFTSTPLLCGCLCKHILLPWLRVTHFTKLELLSSILSREGGIVCVELIAPLLQTEDSPWVEDLPGVEDLMNAMAVQHWNVLCKVLLKSWKELQEWQLPVLAVVVKHAELSCEELQVVVQLLSSSSAMFDQSRHFGVLVTAVAASLSSESAVLVPQLKAIVNGFKGPLKIMKLKTLKIISEIPD